MAAHAHVLGPPFVQVDGQHHDPAPGKRGTLLYYLVWRDGWASREELADLLWGELPDTGARANLRQALFHLRRTGVGPTLDVEPERVRFRGDSDVARFRADLRRHDWTTALQRWRGPFLDGWRLPQAPLADAWIERVRSDLAASWLRASASRAAELEAAGDLVAAADVHGERWRVDVLDEEAIAAQLSLLRRARRDEHAARVAADYRAAFVAEMDLEPDGPLGDLLADAERPAGSRTRPDDLSARGSRWLPTATTSFVGRAAELETLRAWTLDPDPRLLTLVGLGGAGKTRLALELVREVADGGLPTGWAPLESLASDDQVPAAFATAWGLVEPSSASLDALADRIGRASALLVVDNAEHVLHGVREAVTDLLAVCPALRVLVTSRRALDIRSERRLEIDGLRHAPAEQGSDAARLLVARARAIHASFGDGADMDDIEAVCREVGGSPLGLELLASWADVFSPTDMLEEVRSGLDLLASDAAPPRQRGVRAVLDATVEHLSSSAQDAYLRLAPFRGGFDLSAARAVGVDRSVLRELTQSALLRREGRRYARHPLVQRHARGYAEERPEPWAEARRCHGEHYLRRLTGAETSLLRKAGTRATGEMMREDLANVREALLWAVRHAPPLAFLRAYQLFVLLEKSFLFRRDLQLARDLIERSDGPVRAHLGMMEPLLDERGTRSSDFAAADLQAREAIEIGRATRDRVLEGRFLKRRGVIRLLSGDPDGARGFVREASRRLRRRAAGWAGLERIFYAETFSVAAMAQRRRGRYRAARHDVLRAIAIVRGIGDAGLEELGDLAGLDLSFGRYEAALRSASAARRCLGSDPPPIHVLDVLDKEARVRMAIGDLLGARRLAERRLALAETLHGELRRDRVAASHSLLGLLELLEGDLDAAGRHLAIAGDHDVTLVRRARLALARGEPDDAHRFASDAVDALDRLGTSPRRPLELAFARAVQSDAVLARDGPDVAKPYVVDAMRQAVSISLPPVILRALLSAAKAQLAYRDEAAHDVATFVSQHPCSEAEVRWHAAAIATSRVQGGGRPPSRALRIAVRGTRAALARLA